MNAFSVFDNLYEKVDHWPVYYIDFHLEQNNNIKYPQ